MVGIIYFMLRDGVSDRSFATALQVISEKQR